MRRFPAALLGLTLALFTLGAYADGLQTPLSGQTLTVGYKNAPPFVITSNNGDLRGISIQLWNAVSKQIGFKTQYVKRSLPDLFKGVESGKLNASVGALTVTAEREKNVDFSYPFYSTGLAIAVPRASGGFVSFVERFFSWRFFTALGALLTLLLGVGAVVWLFERRRNPAEFGGNVVEGLGSGLWWAAVTMTTVGYGDKSPQTLGGRLVGLIWMFAAIIIISGFTAAIATSLTVGQLSSGIKGESDLAHARVTTVAHSSAASALDQRGIGFNTESNLTDALDALAHHKTDAVVYDAPLLRYRVKNDHPNHITVLDNTFDRQDYAFVLPTHSPLREPLDQAILEYMQTPAWSALLHRYMGHL